MKRPAVLSALAPVLLIVLSSCAATEVATPPSATRTTPGGVADPSAGRTGPLPGGAAASCAVEYSPGAVADRAFAFDGVVLAIDQGRSDKGDESDLGLSGVRFAVAEWFSGGSGDTVTVDMPPQTQEPGMAEYGPSYGIGSRLLVSGEPRWGGSPLQDAIAWGCQFTRYHDARTARSWRQAVTAADVG